MRLIVAATLAFCLAAGSATADEAAAVRPTAAVKPFTIKRVQQFDFVSSANGRNYRIFVAIPSAPAPAHGYPVLYVLDGNAYFVGATEVARALSASGEMPPVVVVGVGYPSDDLRALARLRARDLTLPASDGVAAQIPGMTAADVGGADAFLGVIEREIKPRVSAMVRLDEANSALFGHSLGGLTVLHALFTRPESFRAFIAVSPSIFWNNRAILADEPSFERRVASGVTAPRIFIGVGGEESTLLRTIPAGAGISLDTANAQIRMAKMVDESVGLGMRLEAARGGARYRVATVVFAGESHQTVPFASLTRSLRFAFGPE